MWKQRNNPNIILGQQLGSFHKNLSSNINFSTGRTISTIGSAGQVDKHLGPKNVQISF
jgi:hypothetical protein